MILKLIGAALVVIGCGSVGFRIAANQRQEERDLRQLIGALDYMECELQYRLTPLPALCKQVATQWPGRVGDVFSDFLSEMETQIAVDTESCMRAVLVRNDKLSPDLLQIFTHLGGSVGRFDIEGQLKELEYIRQECRRKLTVLENNRDVRLRGYQTLGLCAGAALAILFV